MKEQLHRTSLAYFDGIRWKKFRQAAIAIPPEERSRFIQKREASQDEFFVTDCEVKSIQFDEEKEKAFVEVLYKWYRLPSMTIRSSLLLQEWEYDDAWILRDQREIEAGSMERPGKEQPADLL